MSWDRVTTEMLEDKKVFILRDGKLFLVTTPEYAPTYPELTFFEVDEESYDVYNLQNVLNELGVIFLYYPTPSTYQQVFYTRLLSTKKAYHF